MLMFAHKEYRNCEFSCLSTNSHKMNRWLVFARQQEKCHYYIFAIHYYIFGNSLNSKIDADIIFPTWEVIVLDIGQGCWYNPCLTKGHIEKRRKE